MGSQIDAKFGRVREGELSQRRNRANRARLDEINDELTAHDPLRLAENEHAHLIEGRGLALEETQRVELGDGPAVALAHGPIRSSLVTRDGLLCCQ